MKVGGLPRDVGLISGWGRAPGEGNGNPLQYSYQDNPIDRGAWPARVHRVVQESGMTEHTHIHMKLAETEKLNKLCFFIWRFPFQGKPTVFRNFILIRKSELI